MRTKSVVKFNNQEYRVGEIVLYDKDTFARIEKIIVMEHLYFVQDEEDRYAVELSCIYDLKGKPIDKKYKVSIDCVEKAAPYLRKRINNLIDEEERLQNILSQCQKEV